MVTTWYHTAVDEAARLLEASLDTGLTEAEAAARLEPYGPNVIEAERERPWWALLLHQFRDPLIYILVTAAVVTLVLREFIDAGVISAVILLNATIGFLQELRAQKAVRALASMTAPKALALVAALLAHLAALYWAPLQTVFRTVPLGGDDWLWIIAIAAPVILGGELDKWWNRRRGRSLG